jgi:CheY-like chemotaxis protein
MPASLACRSDMPAFLMTGDTAPERLREAAASGFHLLHKPVQPMALRAMVNRFLRTAASSASLSLTRDEAAAAPSPAAPP